jgi:hypothetical protein
MFYRTYDCITTIITMEKKVNKENKVENNKNEEEEEHLEINIKEMFDKALEEIIEDQRKNNPKFVIIGENKDV